MKRSFTPAPLPGWTRRVLTLGVLLGAAQAAQDLGPLVVSQAQGSVEVQGASSAWEPLRAGAAVNTALRTGTGRALLQAGEKGQVIVGGGSSLRRFQDEADLLTGRFLLRGPVAVHVQGNHLVMQGSGQARVDLGGMTRRVAVLSGSLRVALGERVYDVKAGEQFALVGAKLTPFREGDPWYEAQFRGAGDATIEATRGPVRVSQGGAARNALIGDDLPPGTQVNTDANAWAEIGFTGGGYLRLCEQSELSVLSVERTSQGREVLLKLTRGNAWNVVAKGQGGYKIDTPVVSTAVRGTVFRVGADGVVKVFEGQVVTPSDGDQPVNAGTQRSPDGQLGTLQLDALDRFNIALDAERARPLTLALQRGPASAPTLGIAARSLPDARLTAVVAGQRLAMTGQDGVFRLDTPEAGLPDGRYRVQVNAVRYGKTLALNQVVTLDRTPPTVQNLKVTRRGHLFVLTGVARDTGSAKVKLSVQIGAARYTHRVDARSGTPFTWALPGNGSIGSITVLDDAGNEGHVPIP